MPNEHTIVEVVFLKLLMTFFCLRLRFYAACFQNRIYGFSMEWIYLVPVTQNTRMEVGIEKESCELSARCTVRVNVVSVDN